MLLLLVGVIFAVARVVVLDCGYGMVICGVFSGGCYDCGMVCLIVLY